jgi:hypothetical protein
MRILPFKQPKSFEVQHVAPNMGPLINAKLLLLVAAVNALKLPTQTVNIDDDGVDIALPSPATTTGPQLDMGILNDDNNVCGYISGNVGAYSKPSHFSTRVETN